MKPWEERHSATSDSDLFTWFLDRISKVVGHLVSEEIIIAIHHQVLHNHHQICIFFDEGGSSTKHALLKSVPALKMEFGYAFVFKTTRAMLLFHSVVNVQVTT